MFEAYEECAEMAKLSGVDPSSGPKWFTLTPVKAPDPTQDATEYMFEWYPGSAEGIWRRTFSVAGWFTGHDDVWVLARAFTEVGALVNSTLPVDLWRTGRVSPAYLYKHVDWLHIDLWGNRNREWVSVGLFVQDGSDPTVFRHFFLRTGLVQAEEFGRELERQIIEASPQWAAQ